MAITDRSARPSLSDEELAQIEAAQSDPAAFAPLYEAYVDLVWRYALSRLQDRERARDATSRTFERAMAALPRFTPTQREAGNPFRSWLMTIARNVVIDDLRRVDMTQPFSRVGAVQHVEDRRPSVEQMAVASEEQRRVQAAINQLGPTQRRIVELRLIGMKAVEIAEVMEMSVSAVNTAHFRAYARLRDLLAEPESEESTS